MLYDYDPSRAASVPVNLLGNFKGHLQTDGYEGYNAVCNNNGLIQLGCWAHVRRKFDEALKVQQPKTLQRKKASLAADAMRRIQLLCQIERKIKNDTPEQRHVLRQQRSLPILSDLRK